MKSQRHLFNIPKDQAYFNTAYFGCLLNESVNAAAYGTNLKAQPWNIHMADFFTDADIARQLFAKLINTDQNNIALIPSASYGFATAAKNINLNSNDSIMVLSEQFPSNYYIWEQLAIKNNATLSVVPRPEDDDWTTNILNTIDYEHPESKLIPYYNSILDSIKKFLDLLTPLAFPFHYPVSLLSSYFQSYLNG